MEQKSGLLFKDRLKMAMKELDISQVQVATLTGKSKASISQYIAGRQIPPEDVQREIAAALGLDPDYFNSGISALESTSRVQNKHYVAEIRTKDVGKLMRMSHTTVEQGLKQGIFPWGYAIETSPSHFRYFINAERFAKTEGVEIPPEMVV